MFGGLLFGSFLLSKCFHANETHTSKQYIQTVLLLHTEPSPSPLQRPTKWKLSGNIIAVYWQNCTQNTERWGKSRVFEWVSASVFFKVLSMDTHVKKCNRTYCWLIQHNYLQALRLLTVAEIPRDAQWRRTVNVITNIPVTQSWGRIYAALHTDAHQSRIPLVH